MEFLLDVCPHHSFSLQEMRSDALLWERGISFSQLSLSQTKPAVIWSIEYLLLVSFKKHEKCTERYLTYAVYLLLLITDQPKEPILNITIMPAFGYCCTLACQVGSAGAEELRILNLIENLLSHALKAGQVLMFFIDLHSDSCQ